MSADSGDSVNYLRLGSLRPGAPWDWRKAAGGVLLGDDFLSTPPVRVFHAYDVNDLAACSPSCGLAATSEEPNEGSVLCQQCVEAVKANPAGRDKR